MRKERYAACATARKQQSQLVEQSAASESLLGLCGRDDEIRVNGEISHVFGRKVHKLAEAFLADEPDGSLSLFCDAKRSYDLTRGRPTGHFATLPFLTSTCDSTGLPS